MELQKNPNTPKSIIKLVTAKHFTPFIFVKFIFWYTLKRNIFLNLMGTSLN